MMRFNTALCWGISLPAMALAAAILAGCPVLADDESAAAGEVALDDIAATPARAGETTRRTFTIRNDGAERVLVTGAQFTAGDPSRVVGFLGGSHSASIGILAVALGEELRLGSRSAWVEVGPLTADLPAGGHVPARLLLGQGVVPLTVHVAGARAAGLPDTAIRPGG